MINPSLLSSLLIGVLPVRKQGGNCGYVNFRLNFLKLHIKREFSADDMARKHLLRYPV